MEATPVRLGAVTGLLEPCGLNGRRSFGEIEKTGNMMIRRVRSFCAIAIVCCGFMLPAPGGDTSIFDSDPAHLWNRMWQMFYALLRRMVWIDNRGKLAPTSLTESLQIRVYQHRSKNGQLWTRREPWPTIST